MYRCSQRWLVWGEDERFGGNWPLLIKWQISPYYHGHRVQHLLPLASANKFAQLDHLSPSKGLRQPAGIRGSRSFLFFSLSLAHSRSRLRRKLSFLSPCYIWKIFNSVYSVLTNNKGSLVLLYAFFFLSETTVGVDSKKRKKKKT